jgi:MFS family permease
VRSLIALLCLTIFSNTFSIGAFPAVLPDMARGAGLADWQLGVVAGAFGFARMLADVPVGLFLTHHLRRAVVLAALALAAGVLLLTTGGPFPVLVAGRVLMGVGHALGMVAGLTAILRFQTGMALASALNAYELSAMLGMLGGTVVMSALPAGLRWNLAYLATCAAQLLGVLVVPLLLAALPRGEADAPGPLFARGVTTGAQAVAAPVTPLLVLAVAAGATVALAYSTIEQFMIPVRASREFDLPRAGVARLLMVMQLFDIVALVPVGLLADRRGARPVLGAILLLLAVGHVRVSFGALPAVVAGCALFGLGMAGWMLPLSVLRRETPPERVAWRTALYRVSVDGGMFLGPFLAGLLGARHAGVLAGAAAAALAATGALLLARAGSSGTMARHG